MGLKIMRVQLQGVAHIDMSHLTKGAKGQFFHRVFSLRQPIWIATDRSLGEIFFAFPLGLNLLSCSCLAK